MSGAAVPEPHPGRLPLDHPQRARILADHARAVARGEAGYVDPVTGLCVMTAPALAERGSCCDHGCRHCPFVG